MIALDYFRSLPIEQSKSEGHLVFDKLEFEVKSLIRNGLVETQYADPDLGTNPFRLITTEESTPSDHSIDSSRWTGLPTDTEITDARRAKLLSLTDRALADLNLIEAGNAEKAQARAIILAIHALSEAPDPPSEIIWKLLERGLALVGVCELFYKIVEALTN
jgi:hypothetical protein